MHKTLLKGRTHQLITTGSKQNTAFKNYFRNLLQRNPSSLGKVVSIGLTRKWIRKSGVMNVVFVVFASFKEPIKNIYLSFTFLTEDLSFSLAGISQITTP